MEKSTLEKSTLALHFGYNKDIQKTMAVPIYQTTAYEYESTEDAADLFALKKSGNIYTRLGNPTTDIFEKRFAMLEGGVGALACASGMAAIFYSAANVCEAGDNIAISSQLYGGSVTLFGHTLRRFGVEPRFFDVQNPKDLINICDSKTKAIFFESLSNPSIEVAEIDQIAAIANELGIITIVDNTVPTPIHCNPIEFGCDIVVHSASKYATGQGLAIGGILVEGEGAKAKLLNQNRYPNFNTPDSSYHGLIYNDLKTPFVARARLSLLRDFGAVLAPFNSWLFIQGLETLSIRMEKHSKNAQAVAQFLESHPKIKKVNYPGLENDRGNKRAKKYFKNGFSALLSFEVGSFEEAKTIVDKTKLFSLVTNIGDSKSIITHPASTTHNQLSPDELKNAGVGEALVRLSIGIEDEKDLIEDLRQALQALEVS